MSVLIRAEVEKMKEVLLKKKKRVEFELQDIELKLQGLNSLLPKKYLCKKNSDKYFKHPSGKSVMEIGVEQIQELPSGLEFGLKQLFERIKKNDNNFKNSKGSLRFPIEKMVKEHVITRVGHYPPNGNGKLAIMWKKN